MLSAKVNAILVRHVKHLQLKSADPYGTEALITSVELARQCPVRQSLPCLAVCPSHPSTYCSDAAEAS